MTSFFRAVVLALTVTGSAAYVHLSTSVQSVSPRPSTMPTPTCPPSQPAACRPN